MRNYELFMRDYMEENRPDELQHIHFEEDTEVFEEDKDPVYKENYFLKENLQTPMITPVLKTNKGRDTIIDFTGKFLDDHAYQLSTSGPVHIFTFADKETSVLYNLFNTDAEQMVDLYMQMIDETYYGKISKFFVGWVKNAPHKVLITAILIDAVQNNYEDIITCCEYLWAFSEYPLIYRDFWKTGVKEDVMNYTIEHLGSKYKIKQMKNLQELLKYDATKSVEAHMDELRKGTDNVYNDLMYRMRNQFKSKMKNISREYYKNSELNATQHNNVTTFDDGELADQEGHNSQTAQIIDFAIEKFASHELNASLLRIAAEGSKVDKGNLSGFISLIYADKSNRLNKFIENILNAYFAKYPGNTKVDPGEFLNFGLVLYKSISRSKDPNLSELNAIINHWMDDIINIRNYYQREPTIISYTRAIFNYFILLINYYL